MGIDTSYYMIYDIMTITSAKDKFIDYKDMLLECINSIKFTDSYINKTNNNMSNVNIIVAVGNYISGKGYPIGLNNTIPWHNSLDMKWFKEMFLKFHCCISNINFIIFIIFFFLIYFCY